MRTFLVLLVSLFGTIYPVVQQPNRSYVSPRPDTLTQYGIAENIGLLAHLEGAGAEISQLKIGDVVAVRGQYGAEPPVTEYFVVDAIHSYQYIHEFYFIDLATGAGYSDYEVFQAMYDDGLTLQTCIAKDGYAIWGRLFVHAVQVRMAATQEIK